MRLPATLLHTALALTATVLDFSVLSVWADRAFLPQVGLVGVLMAAVLAPPRVATVWAWVVGGVASLTTAHGFGAPLVAALVAAGVVRTLAREVLTNRSWLALAALVAVGSILAPIVLTAANRIEALVRLPVAVLPWSTLDPRLVLWRSVGNVCLFSLVYVVARWLERRRQPVP